MTAQIQKIQKNQLLLERRKKENPKNRGEGRQFVFTTQPNYLFLGIRNGLDFFLAVSAVPAAASTAPEAAAEEEGKPTLIFFVFI